MTTSAGCAVGASITCDPRGNPARERIARDTGEGVRATALQGHLEPREWLVGACEAVDYREPIADHALGAPELSRYLVLDGQEVVPDVSERIALRGHVVAQLKVAVAVARVVDREHRADVRMDHEARQRAKHELKVVRHPLHAALCVRDRDHAVDVRVVGAEGIEASCQRGGEFIGAGGRRKDDDVVAGDLASGAGAPIPCERAGLVDPVDLTTWPEAGLVELVTLQPINEVGGVGHLEVDVALSDRRKDLLIAGVGEPETEAERLSAERGVVIDREHDAALLALASRVGVSLPESSPISSRRPGASV